MYVFKEKKWKGEKNSKLLNGRNRYLEQIKNKLLRKEIMRESDQPLHSHFNLVLKIGSLADGNINSHLSKACGARSLHGPPAPSAPWSFLSATRPFSHFSTRPLIACLGQSILVMQPVGSLRSTELNSRSSELRTQLGVVS